ncbi:nucleotidyltransferase family protein [Aeromonas caviae]|uniref:Nucleotidyltransferase family protein n=2 Tax=Aeromonas caviae TaxID=648 RepID=A0AA42RB65_AERCA|nr:nucleotidyltransferase family protein [Aeromonas caviae]MDH0433379.1 nucleotidyltransferase family protein [Aeromonas caviae]MDH1506858.1 nucleotidyltransferase family protein [Aeromonas caviae]MDH1851160.1 nucleotidyltransferase family protein [Aeromonas caviae]MDX7681902.1 nucleotidyltransferase family protein [Aeromonas caviae]MDX7804160.1 nucleotidyltransferase family protein [Aeromonas caviae]
MMRKNWTNVLIAPNKSIREALILINNEALRIALVVDDEKHLLGVLTDGDVRRALLKNTSLSASVVEVMNPHPITIEPGLPKSKIISLMQQNSLLSLPIVDAEKKLLGLETLEDALTKKNYDNPVLIMAGGFGTRLRPLTDNCPKPMLKVGGRPMLETLLLRFIDSGFHNFYISTHYMPEQIKSHFGDGSKWGVKISYVHEESPLGTGGALGLLPDTVSEVPLIMINGDVLTMVNFERLLAYHVQHQAMATMCVREYEYQIPYGVINGEGHKIINMIEKPTQRYFINAGIYVVSEKLRKSILKQTRIDMPVLLENEIAKGHDILMFPIHEYWLDIGRIDDFYKAQSDIQELYKCL